MNYEAEEVSALVSVQAEAATLGAMLLDAEAIDVVSGILKPGSFYRERDNWIYAAIIELHTAGKPADTVAIYDLLVRDGHGQEVSLSYLSDLAFAVPTHLNAAQYAKTVQDRAFRRAIIAAAQQMVKDAHNLEIDSDSLLNHADQIVSGVSDKAVDDDHTHTLKELTEKEVQRIDEAARRVAQGLPATDDLFTGMLLDKFFGGWERTRLYLLAGRPGMGKSAAAAMLADAFAKNGFSGIYFSLEMSADQLNRRYLSQLSHITVRQLKNAALEDAEWLPLMDAANTLQGRSLKINDAPVLTVSGIRRRAYREKRRLQREGKRLDFLIIDYLQLITPEGSRGNRNEEIGAISRGLKLLARELGCVLVALSQLSRAVEGRADKRPTLADLRDSGALEQDADVVDLLYREEYYEPETDKKRILDWIRAKSRDDSTGTCNLYFDAEFTRIADLELQRVDLEIP